jgi:hypothetical protein
MKQKKRLAAFNHVDHNVCVDEGPHWRASLSALDFSRGMRVPPAIPTRLSSSASLSTAEVEILESTLLLRVTETSSRAALSKCLPMLPFRSVAVTTMDAIFSVDAVEDNTTARFTQQ